MEIEEIKRQLPIEDVLQHYGLSLDKNGRIHCPFHEDQTPSMQIYLKTQTFCCFSGNCKAGTGDQIEFIQLKEKSTKHEALKLATSLIHKSPVNLKQDPVDDKIDSTKDYAQLFKRLQQSLNKSPKAKNYIEQRGLKQDVAIGYNAGKIYEHLKYCIIFPLKDEDNQIVSLYGRSIYNNPAKRHFYLRNRTGLYPAYPSKQTKTLIITESIIDAVTLIQVKEHLPLATNLAVLALFGTENLTSEHVKAIVQIEELSHIIFMLNGDQAGQEATTKHAKTLSGLATKVSTVELPAGEDLNSLQLGHDQTIYSHLLKNPKPLYQNGSVYSFSTESIEQTNNETGVLDTSNLDKITYTLNDLQFTLLGGINLTAVDRMKTTLKVSRHPAINFLHQHRDTLDLYSDTQSSKYIRKASEKLEKGSKDIALAISKLIEATEQFRFSKIESLRDIKPKARILTSDRKTAVLNFLKQPDLTHQLGNLIGKSGVIGEENNRLLMFLCYVSRFMNHPLHVISLGASGTGKTYLQEKVAELVPSQDKLEITNLSDNALYYFGKTELKNKLVLIEDLDGADNVMYAIRELMSKQSISKTVTTKDIKGNMRTQTFYVEGPVCFAATTTKEKLYEDNANRSLLIYRDNSKKQQEAIMAYQRKLAAGKVNKRAEIEVKEFIKDMQLVLKNVNIRNPYAEQLVIPSSCFKKLRTNTHYLKFIEVVTFIHQHQRPLIKDEQANERYIETTISDIEIANRLIKDVLLAKADELTGASRSFLEQLKKWVSKHDKTSFYGAELRASLRLSPTTLKRYLYQLTLHGYIRIIGGNKHRTGYEYEIVNEQEYQILQDNITTVLDEALTNLKQSVAQ